VNEVYGPIAFRESYTLHFDLQAREGGLVVRATLITDKPPSMEEVRKLGFMYVDFDEEGCARSSERPTDWILVGEYSLGLPERK
jgi:hypothetical protein